LGICAVYHMAFSLQGCVALLQSSLQSAYEVA